MKHKKYRVDKKNIVPIVATSEGILTFTTSIPFIVPAIIPVTKQHRTVIIMVRSGFAPLSIKTFESFAKTHPENPMIDGKERSISPAIITKVIARARMPENGMVDIKE